VGALGTRPQADGDRSPREASVPQQAVAVLSVPDVPLGQSLRASGISCMGAAGLMVDANIRKLHGEEKIKHLGRFVELLQMDPAEENHTFQIEQLQTVLVERRYGITVERLQSVVAEMMRVGAGRDRARSILARGKSRSRSGLFWQATRDSVLKPDSSSPERGEPSACTKGVDLLTFVEVVVDPDLPTRVGASFRHDVTRIRQLLLQSDIDEIIRKVTRVRKNRASDYASEPEDGGMDTDLILFRLNVLVSVTVLLSVLFLGVSMDYEPSSGWWVAVEGLFAAIFVLELFVKLGILGVEHCLCGPYRMGNLFDLALTMIAISDVTFSAVVLLGAGSADAESGVSTARISLVLRCVRLARIARLVKLFKGPCLKELANMLSGFFIGLPSLVWVMVLLASVIYILALLLKSTVGPPHHARSLVSQCGSGDIGSWDDPACSACDLYAEEYLYSVKSSMMVVFRCVVGDCTSKGGQSLSAHMSGCYTWTFDVVYFLGMVTVVFGLFNIITAIFVQATMDGLRFNHVQNKYAQMYEARYMRRKLEALVARIRHIYNQEMASDICVRGSAKFGEETASGSMGECHLTESVFYKVLADPMVNSFFEDLDVKIDHRLNTFEFFDIGNDGRVSLAELIQTLMKMRGEPHKSDLVASWALLEDFRSQFFEFQKTSLANQRELYRHQRDVTRAVHAFREQHGQATRS